MEDNNSSSSEDNQHIQETQEEILLNKYPNYKLLDNYSKDDEDSSNSSSNILDNILNNENYSLILFELPKNFDKKKHFTASNIKHFKKFSHFKIGKSYEAYGIDLDNNNNSFIMSNGAYRSIDKVVKVVEKVDNMLCFNYDASVLAENITPRRLISHKRRGVKNKKKNSTVE